MKSFAISLAFIMRFKTTQKWAIQFYCVRQSGEGMLFESFQISPAGIDRDAMRFQGNLGAILLWLAHLASISYDKPRHCAAVTRSNAANMRNL